MKFIAIDDIKRRKDKDIELKVKSIEFTKELLEEAERIGIKSGKGNGMLGGFLEKSFWAIISLLGMTQYPEVEYFLSLPRRDKDYKASVITLANNMQEMADALKKSVL